MGTTRARGTAMRLIAVLVGVAACGGSGAGEQDAGVMVDHDGAIDDAEVDAAPAPNLAPTTTTGSLTVEVGGFVAGRLLATDPEGAPLTFAVTGAPAHGTVAWIHPGTGAIGYRPTATAAASDTLTFTASDGVNAAVPGTVAIDIVAFDFLRPWLIVDVNNGLCASTSIDLTRTGNVLDVSSRVYQCSSTTTTMNGRAFDIVGTDIFANGQDVGNLTATGLTITQSSSVSGCGSVTQTLTITQTANGYSITDAYTTGSCGSKSFSGTLRRGAHLVVAGDGAFGSVAYPGPATRTFVLANDGDLPATLVGVTGMAAPFGYAGGSAPGTGGTCGATIAAEEYCTVVLAAGGTAGTHSLSVNASYHNGAYTVAAPFDLSVEMWRPAALEASPPVVDFGLRDRALLPASQTVTITNVGTYPATAIAGTFTGAGYAFAGGTFPGTAGTCAATLAAGESCDLDISFVATTKGTHNTMLALAFNDGFAAANANVTVTGVAANVVGYGFNVTSGGSGRRIVPYYDLVGYGAPITTLTSGYWRELAYDAGADLFYVTNRHTAVGRVTPAGAITTISPGMSYPSGAAIDTTRNRLVVLGSSAYAARDLTTGTWATTAHSVAKADTMKYRPATDTFVAVDAYDFRDWTAKVRVLDGNTLAQESSTTIDMSGIRDTYFDDYAEWTHAPTGAVTDKLYLVAQTLWWSTGAKAAANATEDTYKTALYELDLATNKLSLVWEVPANVVQPASTKVLHGIGVQSCGADCTVDVTVATGKNTILFLTSLNAINWRLNVAAGTTLEKVIVRGYYTNTVENAGGAQIDSAVGAPTALWQTGVTRARYQVENMVGITMSTFQYASSADSFTVGP